MSSKKIDWLGALLEGRIKLPPVDKSAGRPVNVRMPKILRDDLNKLNKFLKTRNNNIRRRAIKKEKDRAATKIATVKFKLCKKPLKVEDMSICIPPDDNNTICHSIPNKFMYHVILVM